MTTYFLRADGTAANKAAATGPGSTQANCMNVAVHNGETFSAGDNIVICDDGGIIRGQITVPSAGSSGNPITYRAENGDMPVVCGADLVSTWAADWAEVMINGGFENWTSDNPDNWTIVETVNSYITENTAEERNGASCAEMVVNGDLCSLSQTLSVSAGTTYTFSGYLKGSGNGQITLNIKDNQNIRYWNMGINAWQDGYIENVVTFTTNWLERVSETIIPEGGCTSITIKAYRSTVSISVYFDDWSWYSGILNVWNAALVVAPEAVYFDGTIGTKEAAKANLNTDQEWFHAGAVLSQYSTSDPDTRYTSPGTEATQRDYGINANAKAYITITDLTIRMCEESGILFNAGTDNGVADGCTIHDIGSPDFNSAYGIYAIAASLTLINNTIHDVRESGTDDGHGILLHTGDNSLVGYNTIYNIASTGIITFNGATGHTIELNIIHDCGDDTNDHGIYIADNNNILRYNLCYSNAGGGIQIYHGVAVSGVDCYYNICYDNNWGIVLDGGTSIDVYNNTCYNNTAGGIYAYASMVSWNVKNNICDGNGGYEFKDGGNAATISHNCFGPEAANFLHWNGVDYDTYDTFETAYGGTTNSVEADPLFNNPAIDDFTLQPDSPCINAGVNLGFSLDYRGDKVPRGTGPDIGANEHINKKLQFLLV